jgi:hypothetical protein
MKCNTVARVAHTTALQRLRQDDHTFEDGLGCIVRHCLKKKTQKNSNKKLKQVENKNNKKLDHKSTKLKTENKENQ